MKRLPKNCIYYLIAFVILYGIEAIIAMHTSGWIRGYIGDVLVLPLLYCLIRIFTPALPRSLPLWLFALGCLAEILQLLRFAGLLGFAEGSLPAVILGTRADWRDVLCYAIGTLLTIIVLRLKGEHHD